MDCRVLELFSGIGGMHYALKLSQISGSVKAAADINTIANDVYRHNHADIKVLNNNIQKFTPEFIETLNVNTILMSPPCQPFTRVGNQKDVDDRRSDPFVHICQILPQLNGIDFILMENVKGFETSKAREMFVESLKKSQFYYQEFILSPTQLGVPNSRHRYYCLARRTKSFGFAVDSILTELPTSEYAATQIQQISDFVFSSTDEISAHIPEKVLKKYFRVLDITYPDSINSMCFTKAYTHYAEGTGSVFCPLGKEAVDKCCCHLQLVTDDNQSIELIKTLQLRYFTPREVANLMCFPVEEFSFPERISTKSRYRLLGNSINVLVVSELIKILFED
ncbi:tRNA (cytosine(38)-C(5))-methyltransferase [Pseudolycoriella hygida]|uniref:tRNA (cytosine(38)-C(5))-methyltransferase n=1 Tax=Pseudolycoriella hygida TaxID=35572 RepID=A0A9Q0MVK3_9DIPT|nr:tRNA (cytosine(38)-C(5))-methyltransferase [Pseudolycoriella hygida]